MHCHGGGESLDAETTARVCRLLERKGKEGNGSGAANHLHTRWGVGQARRAYGRGPLTQPGEDILPSEGKAECCHEGKHLSKKININQ